MSQERKKNKSNLISPTGIHNVCDFNDLEGWVNKEIGYIQNLNIRDVVQRICDSIDDFVAWPLRAELLWDGCDRNRPEGVKVKYHQYPDEIKKKAPFPLDGRANGPAVASFLFAGGIRHPRYGSNNSWSVHHIYSGKFPYVVRENTLHAAYDGRHFTQSAGLVAIHPIADQLADEYPFFSWYLRALSFEQFNYDPDGVFSNAIHDEYGFVKTV
ncbi:TPA: hypothetical protein ACG3KH_004064 [Clostridioides difficile]